MVNLIDIDGNGRRYKLMAASLAWTLLNERAPENNISHQELPKPSAHLDFVFEHPYRMWFVIENLEGMSVGMTYMTKRNEIGIHILKEHQGKGYARNALNRLLSIYRPLPGEPSVRPSHFVANINPSNTASIRLFESIGGKHISNTYRL